MAGHGVRNLHSKSCNNNAYVLHVISSRHDATRRRRNPTAPCLTICGTPTLRPIWSATKRPDPLKGVLWSVVLPSDPDSSSEPILTYATLPIKGTIRLPLSVFGSWCSPVVMRLPPERYTSHPTLNRIPLKVVTIIYVTLQWVYVRTQGL